MGHGVRLTTMQLRYPRFIHSEFMTHRVFSRNASSSRAIPVAKMIEQVRNDPAMPIHWGKNQPGMQANEELQGDELALVQEGWRSAARAAANFASDMASNNAHKQIANRILEPFQFIHVIVTATEWENFFDLRAHADAQPEIHELAVQMANAMSRSQPRLLDIDEWHLPYVTWTERTRHEVDVCLKLSAARCARVSYLTHDGATPLFEKDMELYERLVGSKPLHASPIEHQATPMLDETMWSGNFRGWLQNRQLVESTFNEENK